LTFTTFYRRRFLAGAFRFAAFRFGAFRFGAERFALPLAFDFRLVAITKTNFYLFFYSKTKQNYTN
jgi:hypothetical protein